MEEVDDYRSRNPKLIPKVNSQERAEKDKNKRYGRQFAKIGVAKIPSNPSNNTPGTGERSKTIRNLTGPKLKDGNVDSGGSRYEKSATQFEFPRVSRANTPSSDERNYERPSYTASQKSKRSTNSKQHDPTY